LGSAVMYVNIAKIPMPAAMKDVVMTISVILRIVASVSNVNLTELKCNKRIVW
jgi:hypothetical protein